MTFEAASPRQHVKKCAVPALEVKMSAFGEAGKQFVRIVHRQRGLKGRFHRREAIRVPDRHEELFLLAGLRFDGLRTPMPELSKATRQERHHGGYSNGHISERSQGR